MSREVPVWRRYLRLLGPDVEADVDEEIRLHVELLEEHYITRGVEAAEARRMARRRFGAVEPVKTECVEIGNRRTRAMARAEWVGGLWQDVRLAARSLRRTPAFSLVAALTLALGIGANTAVFTVVHTVLLRPLPYPEPDELVVLTHHAPGINLQELENSEGMLNFYWARARVFSHLSAVDAGERNLTGGDRPARIDVVEVSPQFFDVVRTEPVLGRRFIGADAAEGAMPVAILTESGWASHFGHAPGVVGRTIELDGVRTEVVGIMPEAFAYPGPETDVLLPKHVDPNGAFGAFGIGGLARLAPGVELDQARSEIERLQAQIPEAFPDGPSPDFFERAGWYARLTPLHEAKVGDVAAALWVVLGTVGFLLLIACASVANLFLVRSEARQREVAVRRALGAGPSRLAATFLAESVLLGLAGGALGLLLAYLGVQALVAAGPEQLPRLHEVGLGPASLGLAAAMSLAAAAVFGLLPLPRHLQRPLSVALRDGRGTTGGRERHRARKTLIVAQIALALMLLTGSGLMLRSYARMRAVDPGIRPEGVLVAGVSVGEGRGRDAAAATYQRILEEVVVIPGVERGGGSTLVPLGAASFNGGSFTIRSRPRSEGDLPTTAFYVATTPGYFEAIGMRLVAGRPMEWRDEEERRPVVWVNETFARTYLEGEAIGEWVQLGGDTAWVEIVGVVSDTRAFGLTEAVPSMAYVPMATSVPVGIDVMQLVLRTPGDPARLVPQLRAAVERVDPTVPVTTTRTLGEIVDESMAETSFTMTVLVIASLMALVLGVVGLYGVIGYVVSQRTQEIGVRIALGALPGQVRRMVLGDGLRLAGLGVAVGLAGAAVLSRLLESLLFETSARDPLTFVAVALVLVATSALATWLPARRAARTSPAVALRSE